jgi:hypothetical protein
MGVEVIRVEKQGPYGVMANGVWYGLGKKSGLSPQDLVEGQTYSVDIWKADSGKKYINKVMSSQSGQGGGNSVPPDAPKNDSGAFRPPAASAPYRGTDPDTQERIARNTAYQKATDAASRLLVPFIAKEEDIVPKLKALIEPLAQWLHGRIKNEAVA